ncbi:uncharacterized protein LOC130716620 [Lotus japonicus]|uniref:uncharacterized protein LOC130716613 n=1 Tax=Lotus japonicus TaxID=34305 RepID=UPI00258717F2|nr:uncharacterized protein LOC130716613 [Lotus japonicus]XP_057422585.1 uncharacterized protein LOC130716620 [Lotus japonicus]
MEVPENRKWMDNRLDCNKHMTDEFIVGIHEFIKFACEQKQFIAGGGLIRCPCKKCKCMRHEKIDTVKVHLCMKGFMSNYHHWTNHGEPIPRMGVERNRDLPKEARKYKPASASSSDGTSPSKIKIGDNDDSSFPPETRTDVAATLGGVLEQLRHGA